MAAKHIIDKYITNKYTTNALIPVQSSQKIITRLCIHTYIDILI